MVLLSFVGGFEGMMTRMITHPDLVETACRRYLAKSIRQVQHAKSLNADCIWIEECFTDMISPANVPNIQFALYPSFD